MSERRVLNPVLSNVELTDAGRPFPPNPQRSAVPVTLIQSERIAY
jgi:hypothetical protein